MSGEKKPYHPRKDLSGQRFGRLTVIEPAYMWNRCGYYLCRCDCGKETYVRQSNLTGGLTKSCGCENNASWLMTHGGSDTRLYRIWSRIKSRCYDPSFKTYSRYGGSGIKVCDEWKGNFAAFRDWAMANGYREDLSIDRFDPDGDFSPENCRWVNERDQMVFQSKK